MLAAPVAFALLLALHSRLLPAKDQKKQNPNLLVQPLLGAGEMEQPHLDAGCGAPAPSGLSPATERARCKNCRAWFVLADFPALKHAQTPDRPRQCELEYKCRFHSGTYSSGGTTCADGCLVGWSCCKAIQEQAPGCQLRAEHSEDKTTTARLRAFQQELARHSAADLGCRKLQPAETNEGAGGEVGTAECVGTSAEADGDEIVHHVSYSDTLAGISLRYGVSAQRIKEVNCIMGAGSISMVGLCALRCFRLSPRPFPPAPSLSPPRSLARSLSSNRARESACYVFLKLLFRIFDMDNLTLPVLDPHHSRARARQVPPAQTAAPTHACAPHRPRPESPSPGRRGSGARPTAACVAESDEAVRPRR